MRFLHPAIAALLLTTLPLSPAAAFQTPPEPTPVPPGAPGISARKVLLIGLDGVRVDILAEAATPNIDALIAGGVYSDRALNRMPTVSGPCWSSMLIGVWWEKHGVRGNDFAGDRYDEYPSFLDRLERIDPRYATAAFVTWPPLMQRDEGRTLIGASVDVRVLRHGGDLGYGEADAQAARLAAGYLRAADPDAVFVYLGDIDEVGHATSSLAPEYRRAIETADAQVGQLMEALRARPRFDEEDWLILMSTDHGRRDDGGHGRDSLLERTIFYLASGPAASAAPPADPPRIVDIAVTALAHLGIPIDPAWNLDGRPVGLKGR